MTYEKITKKVLELLILVEDGVLSYSDLATAALNYMSEDGEPQLDREKEDHT